jgi:hypothetical protein
MVHRTATGRAIKGYASLRSDVLKPAPELRIQSSINIAVGKYVVLQTAAIAFQPLAVLLIDAQNVTLPIREFLKLGATLSPEPRRFENCTLGDGHNCAILKRGPSLLPERRREFLVTEPEIGPVRMPRDKLIPRLLERASQI